MSSELDNLYAQLSGLRSRQRSGEDVNSEITQILVRIEDLERPVKERSTERAETSLDAQQSTINLDIGKDAVGNAVGAGARVEADIIAGTYNTSNSQYFNTTTHRHENYGTGSTGYAPQPAHVEVAAGEIVAGWFQRAFNAAPQAVSVGLATVLPVLFLFSPDTIAVGIVGLLTITPVGIFVMLSTNFMRIPREAYRNNKLLFYASWFMSSAGILTVILFVIGYYLAMAVLSAMMGAMREQIYRR